MQKRQLVPRLTGPVTRDLIAPSAISGVFVRRGAQVAEDALLNRQHGQGQLA